MTAVGATAGRTADAGFARPARSRVWSVYRAERRKLSSQLAVRLVALICVLGPFVFAAILKVQSGSPTDTLYGVWVHSSGFALSLVLLAFAGAWGFPLVGGIVAGDMFSGEDRYGTWKLVLTRSCTRRDLFVGKLLTAATYVIGLLVLTAASSILAGVILIGAHSLVSLNGTVLTVDRSLATVLVSWAVCVFPALAFASLGVLLSVATRNGIVGVIGPALASLAMQLLLLVGSGVWMHFLLVGSAFNGWHALLRVNPFYGPLLIGIAVSIVWTVAALTTAWLILRGRDFAGTPVTRRQGWVMPARVAVALAAVIAFVAIAGNWGPVGVTAARLKADFIPTFNNLTLLQQRQLGRTVPAGAKVNIVLPSCSRRGSTAGGPGDWVCTLNVLIPSSGSLPPEPTPVAYDVSVQSDGCYKAQSPPSFIGQQLMRDSAGHNVVNPLYTIYGCFNIL
jgi:ABC-2 type transport system permease protein